MKSLSYLLEAPSPNIPHPRPSRLVAESISGIKLTEKQGWMPSARWEKPVYPEEWSVFCQSEEGSGSFGQAVNLVHSLGPASPLGWLHYPSHGKMIPWGGIPRSGPPCWSLYHSSGRRAYFFGVTMGYGFPTLERNTAIT